MWVCINDIIKSLKEARVILYNREIVLTFIWRSFLNHFQVVEVIHPGRAPVPKDEIRKQLAKVRKEGRK